MKTLTIAAALAAVMFAGQVHAAIAPVTCTTSGDVFRSGIDADANGFDDSWEVSLMTRPPFDRPYPPTRTLADAVANGFAPATIVTTTPGSWFVPPTSPPRWIAHNGSASHGFAEADVFYRLNVPIAGGVSLPAFELELTYYVDNNVYAIYVNGVREYTSPLPAVPDPWNGPGATTPLTVRLGTGSTNNWVAGNNEIIIQTVSGFAEQGFLVAASAGPSCANSAPVATSVAISGGSNVGVNLSGNYNFSDADADAQGTSTFRWISSLVNTLPPTGAIVSTSTTYTPVAGDIGRFLFFCVTPIASAGVSPGVESCSAPLGPIIAAVPTTANAIPVDNPFALVALAGLIGVFGVRRWRRK